jgi:hypothetical protein
VRAGKLKFGATSYRLAFCRHFARRGFLSKAREETHYYFDLTNLSCKFDCGFGFFHFFSVYPILICKSVQKERI